MPLYSYECEICDTVKDSYNTIAERRNAPHCWCGQPMELKIMPVNIAPILGGVDFPGYQCVVMDEYVSSRKRRKYIMDSNNLVEAGDNKPSKARQAKMDQHDTSLDSMAHGH